MKNLKKAFALVLTVAMLMSMMVFAAGAADFTDSDKIVNTEAVDTMVALNIINGKGDGSYYDPAGIVTRAEMAKMIAVALNGGKAPQVGNATSFTDTVGNWAAGYIEYCYNLGIVSGRGNGIFDPSATVTATEAAKMLLVAIGYDSELESFTGATWAIKVNSKASYKDLYDKLSLDVSAGLTRDNAAQMVYNAINAVKVKYDYKLVTGANGNLSTVGVAEDLTSGKLTIADDKFGLQTTYGYMTGSVGYSTSTSKYSFALNTVTNKGLALSSATARTKTDYSDLYGQYVKVLWKNDNDQTIFGIYAEDSKVMATGYNGNIGAIDSVNGTLKIAGTAYKVENTTIPVVGAISGANYGTISAITATPPYSLKLIDTDDNGKADVMVVAPFSVEKVTYVGADSFTVSSTGSLTKENVSYYEGIAKNDYVTVTAAVNAAIGKVTVAKTDINTGTISGTKESNTKFLIDGTWYTKASGVTAGGINDTIDYVAFGGILYYSKVTETGSTSKDLAMVITAAPVTGTGVESDYVQAKLLLADGTKSVVKISKVDGTSVTTSAATTVALIGQLATYRVDSDGKYELTTVDADNLAGYKGVGTTAAYSNKTVGGKELADDAVVFFLKGTAGTANTANDGKVYTGKELKNAYGTTSYGTAGGVLYNTENGFEYGKIAVISFTTLPSITSGSNYGYLTADTYETVESGSTYRNYTIWTGSAALTAKEKSSDGISSLKAGTIVTYDVTSDTVIKNVSVVNAIPSSVTGWDGDSKISITGLGNSKVNDDTTVIYINSKDKKGVAGGAISIADEPTTGVYTNNVRYIGTSTAIDLLIVDVNNKLETIASVTLPGGSSEAVVEAALANTTSVTVSGAFSTTGTVIASGKTLIVTGALTATGDITGTGTLSVASFSNGATSAAYAKTSTVAITVQAAAAVYEAVPVVAGKTLVLSAASSDNASATTWYTAAGSNESTPSAGDGVIGTSLSGVAVAADTYVGSTVYTSTGGATAVKWLAQ